jgi:TATA-box binding protein (TBP) (component of TFIID and TFIIIB)
MDMYTYIQEMCRVRERVTEMHPGVPEPSWLKITTITMHSRNDIKVDIQKFKERFRPITIRPEGSNGPGFQWTMDNTGFYNQVSIRYHDDYSEKSIKIFPNGTIHSTGANTPFDGQRILNQVAFIMKEVLELEKLPVLSPFDISMINSNFNFNSILHIHKVMERFARSKDRFKVTYEPDRYSAVKVKFSPGKDMKIITASIFKSGAVLVGGAKKLEELVAAYDLLTAYIDPSVFVAKSPDPKKFDIIMGASFDEWNRVLQNKM